MVEKISKKKKCRKKIKKCVECDSTEFHQEYKLREVSCCRCGLVLVAPPSPDFVVDGYGIECIKKKKG